MRTFHLVDVENLAGENHAQPHVLQSALTTYVGIAPFVPGDHGYVAVDRMAAEHIMWATPPGMRCITGVGKDGADQALVRAVDIDLVASRYERLVIASGDHFFVPLVEGLKERGIWVRLVAIQNSVSADLYRAAGDAVILSRWADRGRRRPRDSQPASEVA